MPALITQKEESLLVDAYNKRWKGILPPVTQFEEVADAMGLDWQDVYGAILYSAVTRLRLSHEKLS